MKKKLIVFFLFIVISINLYSSQYNIIKNYDNNAFSIEVESLIEDILDESLSSYFFEIDDLKKNITISYNVLDYTNNLLIIEGNLLYKNNKLPLKISFEESDYIKMKQKLDLILKDFFLNDLSKLISNNDNEKMISLKNSNFINNYDYDEGDLLLLSNKSNEKKSLAQVNSVFEKYATLNYFYKNGSFINSIIEKGPLNEIDLGISYDFENNIIGLNVDYLFLNNILKVVDLSYLGLGVTYYNNPNDNNIVISSDLLLNICLPLSTIISNNKILVNTSVYNKTKIGVLYLDTCSFHSQAEIGVKTYISSKFSILVGYKIDSYKKSNYNFIVNIGYLF